MTAIGEWKKGDSALAKVSNNFKSQDTASILPSPHQAQRTILTATCAISELVVEPYSRVQEVGCQFFGSRAIFVAAENRILDLLAEAGEGGPDLSTIAKKGWH